MILWRIDGKLESHIVQSLSDDNTTIELYSTTCAQLVGYIRFNTFGGSDVQLRIHRIACKLYVATLLHRKGLKRDDRQRVLHLTTRQRIATRQVYTV